MKILNFRPRSAVPDEDESVRFKLIDRTGKFDSHRDVIDAPCVLEPHDDRTDMCVSLPVRSVVSQTAGVAVEIGPFTLDTGEVVKLYNALAAHINTFPSEFRLVKS
ncbi:hypothetical protein A5731_00600 [Mycolicibacterium conceptionense]|nr:hypothetical protein A5718_29990 [Mycolicibacterium conceptionense]OBF09242.1 hypothetical protein A5731_00600 [Mycolicibacterium conceptionense]